MNIIFWHTFLWAFLGASFFVFAKSGTQEDKKVQLTDSKLYSSWIKGVKLDFPKEISLKEGTPDLSQIIQQFKKVEESNYDNILALERIQDNLLQADGPIKKLCSKTTNSGKCLDEASMDLEKAIEKIEQKMRGRILYPIGYHPLSEAGVKDIYFEEAFKHLGCENCRHYIVYGIFMRGSQRQYQKLYNKLKDKNKQCQKDLLRSISEVLQSETFPKQCLEEKNKNHPVCRNMRKEVNILRARVSQLIDLAYGQEGTEAKALCMDCVEWEEVNTFEKLGKFLKELSGQSHCLELNPGEEKDVFPGNGLYYDYVLKRDRDGSYSITFPMNFHIDGDYDGPVSREQAPEHYRERVQKCLLEANQNLLGPKGERLKIQIADPKNNKSQSQCGNSLNKFTKDIAIGSSAHRSDSGKYASDIDCPSIVHEVLHLAGLCDEYEEIGNGFYTDPETGEVMGQNFGGNQNIDSSAHNFTLAFDCRVTAKNSIMANHYTRWDNVKKGKNKSLLTPGQFQSILYGSCPEKNKRFNECSKLAYQSSVEEDCLEKKTSV